MCTVTYIKEKNSDIILTSNRDERIHRKTLLPEKRTIGEQQVIYPMDDLGGGTWISMGINGVSCCLLNGAFAMHNRKNNYRKSRGQILLDVFRYHSVEEFIDKVDLTEIEPFTLIIIDAHNGKLIELIWDDIKKHITVYDPIGNYFWSSAVLYSKQLAHEREQHFRELILEKKHVDQHAILNLHGRSKQDGGFILSAVNGAETLSISQLILGEDKGSFYYNDLLNNRVLQYNQHWEHTASVH